ncbi:MAG TPA: hypothetical protein VGX25_23435 [Actinophytocola sp.]|uniref:hypothetical protein n=1 Tax=Actinophytocola sp. TaxID=1872138 RepID=UPI002DDD3D2B|nr:hypothetical protein [Actinophytocola sp.]HEV2782356.1 hypothetical protein [Actinophytocola sp.]
MNEILPIVAGLLVGLLLGGLKPARRAPLGVTLAVVLGSLATIITGEYRIGWEFLLIDIPLVGVASVVSYLGARALRVRLTRPTEG